MSRLARLRTLARLGPGNIARVAMYRLGLRSGWHPVQRLRGAIPRGRFYRAAAGRAEMPAPNRQWRETALYFGWYRPPLPDQPPDWFANPFSDRPQPDASRDWWRIGDFGSGDIKGLWELSRLDWAVAWGTEAAHGDARALARLNQWLGDWAARNPPFKGPNWKCGQEASIRVMHLCLVAWILGQDADPEAGLADLIAVHLQRVAPTMSYAIGQANNHGTSEAAALFIGGTMLIGRHPHAQQWAAKGRRWLEVLSQRLIERDGSFSQYSVNYHRMMLDACTLAEAWRRYRHLPAFSQALAARLGAAAKWLCAFTDLETGDAPNIGANDGARLMPLTSCDYRDYRPSVQLAFALFLGQRAFAPGRWDDAAAWLGVKVPGDQAMPVSQTFDAGGYHVIRLANVLSAQRYPRFRFRPGQADALHLDLWVNGSNMLRDAGTFSYNTAPKLLDYFGGVAGHNTIQFDGRDQMPRISRFLWGGWLRTEECQPVREDGATVQAGASYRDATGARHCRKVTVSGREVRVEDLVEGFARSAVLRWRLLPGNWRLERLERKNATAYQLTNDGGFCVEISASVESVRCALTHGWESRYYLQKSPVPVVEFEIAAAGAITTRISWSE